jgi:dTDP-4-amino-4,6-dideoxygalactose transaminase
MQKCFDYLGMRPEDCPESSAAASTTLAVPIYPELTEEQQRHVVDSVVKFYRK